MPSSLGLLAAGYSRCPLVNHQQGHQNPHHKSQLDPLTSPQLPTEEATSADQTFLLDGQAVHPYQETSFSFNV